MNRHVKNLGSAVLVMGMILCATPGTAQVGQAELAHQVLHADRTARLEAVDRARLIEPSAMHPQLRAALVEALEEEGVLVGQRRRGEVGYFEHPELIARLALVVGRFNDPETIPALVGALGMSPPAMRSLAEFGELAAQPVVRIAEQADDGSVIMDALTSLRFMAEGHVKHPLSRTSRERIANVAMSRLTTPQRFATNVWRSIDLAIALDDPELRRVVETLSVDRDSVRALGVTEPDLIQKTQQRALDRLTGVPPLPRWR